MVVNGEEVGSDNGPKSADEHKKRRLRRRLADKKAHLGQTLAALLGTIPAPHTRSRGVVACEPSLCKLDNRTVDWSQVPRLLNPMSQDSGFNQRSLRKRGQVGSLFVVLKRVTTLIKNASLEWRHAHRVETSSGNDNGVEHGHRRLRICDLSCGSGVIAAPLAALLSECDFTMCAPSAYALTLLKEKVDKAGLTNVDRFVVFDASSAAKTCDGGAAPASPPTLPPPVFPAEEYFDVLFCAQSCGAATVDTCLDLALTRGAPYVLNPCCYSPPPPPLNPAQMALSRANKKKKKKVQNTQQKGGCDCGGDGGGGGGGETGLEKASPSAAKVEAAASLATAPPPPSLLPAAPTVAVVAPRSRWFRQCCETVDRHQKAAAAAAADAADAAAAAATAVPAVPANRLSDDADDDDAAKCAESWISCIGGHGGSANIPTTAATTTAATTMAATSCAFSTVAAACEHSSTRATATSNDDDDDEATARSLLAADRQAFVREAFNFASPTATCPPAAAFSSPRGPSLRFATCLTQLILDSSPAQNDSSHDSSSRQASSGGDVLVGVPLKMMTTTPPPLSSSSSGVSMPPHSMQEVEDAEGPAGKDGNENCDLGQALRNVTLLQLSSTSTSETSDAEKGGANTGASSNGNLNSSPSPLSTASSSGTTQTQSLQRQKQQRQQQQQQQQQQQLLEAGGCAASVGDSTKTSCQFDECCVLPLPSAYHVIVQREKVGEEASANDDDKGDHPATTATTMSGGLLSACAKDEGTNTTGTETSNSNSSSKSGGDGNLFSSGGEGSASSSSTSRPAAAGCTFWIKRLKRRCTRMAASGTSLCSDHQPSALAWSRARPAEGVAAAAAAAAVEAAAAKAGKSVCLSGDKGPHLPKRAKRAPEAASAGDGAEVGGDDDGSDGSYDGDDDAADSKAAFQNDDEGGVSEPSLCGEGGAGVGAGSNGKLRISSTQRRMANPFSRRNLEMAPAAEALRQVLEGNDDSDGSDEEDGRVGLPRSSRAKLLRR